MEIQKKTRDEMTRGTTLSELEAAGVAVVPVHHDTRACAADVLNCGRALAYQMAADGRLPVIRLGRRVVVSVAGLREMTSGRSIPVASTAMSDGASGAKAR